MVICNRLNNLLITENSKISIRISNTPVKLSVTSDDLVLLAIVAEVECGVARTQHRGLLSEFFLKKTLCGKLYIF